ncbi:uncharacterized protein PHALS_02428 [Plasmopara halstedii]|uniref:Uncharacterized protein n=1 Tax=Plasmopara halstedii TaxID=4781 RepID=A0A0P1A834_PLAHL|nr:uncharacterized protein PHALS_02428 [Plasmopara halstedii]CEG36338.1 hypothetical protein PHALS_02428 [Plasmopara halstedii]|eukprot:XP_024572707.1 hypothetical protein PHALS_02428 [Plasmopara halstedii]
MQELVPKILSKAAVISDRLDSGIKALYTSHLNMVFTVCELRNFLAEFVVCMLVGSQLSFARVLHGKQKKIFQ